MESSVYRLFLSGEMGRTVALAIGPREWSRKPARDLIQRFWLDPQDRNQRDDRCEGVDSRLDRILKGAKPGEMPVEQPMQLKHVINLKAAKTDRPDDSIQRAGERGQGDHVSLGEPRIKLDSPSANTRIRERLRTL